MSSTDLFCKFRAFYRAVPFALEYTIQFVHTLYTLRDCLRICDLVGGSFPQEGPEAIKVLVAAMRDKEIFAEMAVKTAAVLSICHAISANSLYCVLIFLLLRAMQG